MLTNKQITRLIVDAYNAGKNDGETEGYERGYEDGHVGGLAAAEAIRARGHGEAA